MSPALFAVAKWVWWLARPSTLLTLLLAAGVLLLWRHRPRTGRALCSAALIGLLLSTLVPLASWLAAPLEGRYARPADLARVDGIVVLGGALEPHTTAARGVVSLNDAAERMTAFATLARQHPEAELLFTGGSSQLTADAPTEAAMAEELFASLGLTERVRYESASRDTFENAQLGKRIAQPQPGERWLIVTSALHMPRAVGAFEAVDWPVTPYPVDYLTSGRGTVTLPPDIGGNLTKLDRVVGEWVSLVAFRLLGRTPRLVP